MGIFVRVVSAWYSFQPLDELTHVSRFTLAGVLHATHVALEHMASVKWSVVLGARLYLKYWLRKDEEFQWLIEPLKVYKSQ
jgi:hypothetical protein